MIHKCICSQYSFQVPTPKMKQKNRADRPQPSKMPTPRSHSPALGWGALTSAGRLHAVRYQAVGP